MSAAPFAELRNQQEERLDFAFHPAAGGAAGNGGAARGPVVVLAHGVTSNKDRPYLIALAEALAADGVAALRLSFSGNGASEGRFEESTPTKEADDLCRAIDALAAAGFARIGYAGHSMGAAVGLLRATQPAPARPLAALVSLAGMVHVERFFARHVAALPFGAPMLGKAECPWSRALAEDAARLGSLAPLAARVTIPWLLVHGDADETVPIQDARDAVAAFEADAARARRRPELVPLPGADHRFTGAIPALVAAVVPWLARELAAAPALAPRPPEG